MSMLNVKIALQNNPSNLQSSTSHSPPAPRHTTGGTGQRFAGTLEAEQCLVAQAREVSHVRSVEGLLVEAVELRLVVRPTDLKEI